MDRLLPYHIYQYPKSDLDANKIPSERQGKKNNKKNRKGFCIKQTNNLYRPYHD